MASFRDFVYSVVPSSRSSQEEKTMSDNDEESLLPQDDRHFPKPHKPESRCNRLRRVVKCAHVALTMALVVLVIRDKYKAQETNRWSPMLVYSPAQDAVRYVAKTFTSSLDYGKTEFQGRPSEKNNKKWTDLILRGLTRITAEEAAPMNNRTMPIPDDPDHYIISLAVFHQLHCLNAIRFAIWNETMDEEKERIHHETSISHLDHCVDLIRQALMCAADVTPFVWGRDPRDGRLHGLTTVTHTCRDWDPIQQWASDRPIVTGFNITKPIERDPLDWGGFQYIMDYGEVTDWEGQKPDYEKWAREKTHEQHLRGHVGYVDKTNYP